MKITRVEAVPLSIPFQHGLGSGRRLDFCLVRVETDAALVGWGDAFAYNCRTTVATAVNDMIAPLTDRAASGVRPGRWPTTAVSTST